MNRNRLRVGCLLAATTVAVGGLAPAVSQAQTTSTLVAVRASHHSGFDRLVLQFTGAVPTHRTLAWVDRVIADPSGRTMRVAGHAFAQLRLSPAAAHTDQGATTVARRFTFALPNITQVVISGDFEAVLSVAIGAQRRTTAHVTTLTSPSRVVVDLTTPYRWVNGHVFYLNAARYATGTTPYTIGVTRPLIPPATARQALERLFAGPTPAESARHLRFVSSRATGFTGLSISSGVARVRLTGGCASGGATYTIANEIGPTLKQFSTVRFVKIYDPQGRTERPTGSSDSIPTCLEP